LDSQAPGHLSRADAFRVVVGFLMLILGGVILYRTIPAPSFSAVLLGLAFVGFGVFRLFYFFRWLKRFYVRQ